MPDTPEPSGPTGSVRRTSAGALVAAAAAGAGSAWLLFTGLARLGGEVPRIPWFLPAGIALLALATFAATMAVRRRRRSGRGLEVNTAVGALAWGKTALLGGVALAAGYLVVVMMFISRMDAQLPRERVLNSALAVVAGLATAVAGWLLERSCELPKEPEDESPEG